MKSVPFHLIRYILLVGVYFSTTCLGVISGSQNIVSPIEMNQGIITASGLNVRGAPVITAEKIDILPRGSIVTILDMEGNWVRISVEETEGWVANNYVKKGTAARVNASSLNVRSKPAVDSEILFRVPDGQSVFLVKVEDDWGRIIESGREGWVVLQYLWVDYTAWVADSLSVARKYPMDNAPIAFTPNAGDQVTVINQQESWCQVHYEGESGWIDSSALSRSPISALPADDTVVDTLMPFEPAEVQTMLDPGPFKNLSYTDRLLAILALAIMVLLVFVVLFGILTIALRIKNIQKAKRWEYLESVWEPLLVRVISGDETEERVHQQVARGDRLRFIDFLMRFTHHFRGEELEIIQNLAKPYLPLVENQLTAKSSEIRARAIKSLSTLGFLEYKTDIIEALDDPSPLVAMIAARSLMREEEPDLAFHVIERLPRFMHWSVNYLSSMLADVGAAIAPALRKIYTDTSYPPRTRSVCAEALAKLHDFTSADVAVSVLQEEKNRDLSAASLRLIAVAGLPKHLPVVLELIQSNDFVVRAQAYRALGNIGDRTEIPLLESGIDDAEPWVAIQAAESLYEVGGKQHLKELAVSDHPRAMLAQQILDESTA